MNRSGLYALTFVVLGLTLAVADIGAEHVAYFPPALQRTSIACAPGPDSPRPRVEAINEGEVDWYGGQLRAADEPSLYLASLDRAQANTRTWRFTWLRSFHHPVIVRIDEAASGAMRLTAKHLSGEGGYGAGQVDQTVKRLLTPDEKARFEAVLASTHALDLPAKDCRLGTDGSSWVLESRGPDGYRFVERWTPESGPVRDLGLTFLGFTGFTLDPLY